MIWNAHVPTTPLMFPCPPNKLWFRIEASNLLYRNKKDFQLIQQEKEKNLENK